MCSTGLQKICQGQTKGFLGSRRHTWAETIAKSNKNYQVKSHKGSTFFKKGPHFGQNSHPGKSDPYTRFRRQMFQSVYIEDASISTLYQFQTNPLGLSTGHLTNRIPQQAKYEICFATYTKDK